MRHYVTLTLKQMSHLRMLCRLQRIRAIRITLDGYKNMGLREDQAIGSLMEREDAIGGIDGFLMFAEHNAMTHGLPTFTFGLDEGYLAGFKSLIEFPYSTAQLPGGSQGEAAQVLLMIEQEREGLILALSQTSEPLPVITQRGSQVKN